MKIKNKNIIISDKINLSNSDKIIIKNLKLKYNIHITQNHDNCNYVLQKQNNNEQIYHSMSNIIKNIMLNIDNHVDRLKFLENLFINEKIVILAPGPSYGFLTYEEKKFIINNFITIAIKYVLDDLDKLNLQPTFFIYNEWLSFNNVGHYLNLGKNLITLNITNNNIDFITFKIKPNQTHNNNF